MQKFFLAYRKKFALFHLYLQACFSLAVISICHNQTAGICIKCFLLYVFILTYMCMQVFFSVKNNNNLTLADKFFSIAFLPRSNIGTGNCKSTAQSGLALQRLYSSTFHSSNSLNVGPKQFITQDILISQRIHYRYTRVGYQC